jgi:hypothetical protein
VIDNSDFPVPPWYRQFWPWFLIALPASVVVAGFYTLFLAIKYSDTLVSDNYYKDGLAINQVLSQDVRAQEMGLSAEITFHEETGDTQSVEGLVTAALSGAVDKPEMLTLQLQHPTDATADMDVVLMAVGDGSYRGRLPVAPRYRFYLRLLPGLVNDSEQEKSLEWRLNGELDFGRSGFGSDSGSDSSASQVQLHAIKK